MKEIFKKINGNLLYSILLIVLFILLSLFVFLMSQGLVESEEEEKSNIVEEEKDAFLGLKVNFLEAPISVEDFNDDEFFGADLEYAFRTGIVESGEYVDSEGEKYDLSGYSIYRLYYACNTLRVFYSDLSLTTYVTEDFSHPSCALREIPTNIVLVSSYIVTEGFDLDLEIVLGQNEYYKGSVYTNYGSDILRFIVDRSPLTLFEEKNGVRVYMYTEDNSKKYVIFSEEGIPYGYVLKPTIFESPEYPTPLSINTVPITLLNTQKVSYEYSLFDPESCNVLMIDSSNLDTLKAIGKGIDGSDIYIKSDSNDSYLKMIYNDFYIEKNIPLFNQLEDDDEQPFSYEEYLEFLPVIYWKDPFDTLYRFVRVDFFQEPVSCSDPGI